MTRIRTDRMDLIACDVATARAMRDDHAELQRLLGARVPEAWPPELLRDAMGFLVSMYERDSSLGGWGMWSFVLRDDPAPVLVGSGGFKGKPGAIGGPGTVEVGYGVLEAWQRRGLASEATEALVRWALAQPGVDRVIAHTFERHDGSIGVLRRCGFRLVGAGFEKVDEADRQGRGELVLYERRR